MSGIHLNDVVVCCGGLKNCFMKSFSFFKGDSGGPLYYFDPNIGRDRLIGVTQSGVYCGDVGFYESVAPRVNSFVMPNLHSACRFN